MINVDVVKRMSECMRYIRDNMTKDNWSMVYEIACSRYGSDIVGGVSFLILVLKAEEEAKHG